MEYHQRSIQEELSRWERPRNEDDGGHYPPALGRSPSSTAAEPIQSLGRGPVYPRSDIPPTVDSDSVRAQTRMTDDVPTLPEGTNPFAHLQSSIGRLSVQNSGEITGKMALGIPRESIGREHEKIRYNPSSNKQQAPPRLQKSHIMPSGYMPQTQTTLPNPPRVPLNRAFTMEPEHEYSRPVEKQRSARRRMSFDEDDDYYSVPIQETYHISSRDRGIPRIIDTKYKYKDPYAAAPGVTFSKVKTAPRYETEYDTTSRRYGEEDVISSDYGHRRLSYESRDGSDPRTVGSHEHFKPELATSFRNGERTSRPIHNNFSASYNKTGISITISRDSSADECVRHAKLLADMGERSRRMRNRNDT